MNFSKSILRQKPGQLLEFLPDPDPQLIAETLTAFANSEGGALVLGVAPDGHLGTIFVEEDASDALQSALRLCKPPVHTDWYAEEVAGGVVVILRVERSGQLHSLADGRILVRRGTQNVPSDSVMIEQMLAN
ncbi:MAG: ATP-binding protein, partial [Caldilineaceae bacterium]|nr:ATP-binding protein [Caldilineaceae bacterium]